LHSKDGKLGFITSKGFVCATNFVVDIASQVHSIKYVIKGYEVLVKKAGADSWVDFFIPEADIYNPVRLVLVMTFSKNTPVMRHRLHAHIFGSRSRLVGWIGLNFLEDARN
jgi:hypothetical protein